MRLKGGRRGSIQNRPGCKQKRLDGCPLGLSWAILPPGDRPWKMNNGNQEETKSYLISIKAIAWGSHGTGGEGGRESKTYLFDSFNSPARAQYHAENAVSKLNKPLALITDMFGLPLASRCKYPIPSNRKTRSRVKKMKNKTRFERSVAMTITVVNINQPWVCDLSQ